MTKIFDLNGIAKDAYDYDAKDASVMAFTAGMRRSKEIILEHLENILEEKSMKASLDYTKSTVTTNDATINVMAGLGFKDGAEWLMDQLIEQLTEDGYDDKRAE
jgi:hypothetical protein